MPDVARPVSFDKAMGAVGKWAWSMQEAVDFAWGWGMGKMRKWEGKNGVRRGRDQEPELAY